MICHITLFDVTEQGHTPQGPVIWSFVRLQQERKNVGQVSAVGFLVHGTLVHVGAATSLLVAGKHMYDWQKCVQNFRGGFHNSGITFVPATAIQKQAINVHACERMKECSDMLGQLFTHTNIFFSTDGSHHMQNYANLYLCKNFQEVKKSVETAYTNQHTQVSCLKGELLER